MSNYIEHNDRIAFHPGYYIKEIVEESRLTQEDFARRLGTTPKNLSVIIHGEQNLTVDIATKLSRMLGTTVTYWLNLQNRYDEMTAEFLSDEELKKEREIYKLIDYNYFIDNFHFPELPRKVDDQIQHVREFLQVSSLTVLQEQRLSTSFRSYSDHLSLSNIVNANVMVQIAVNQAIKTESPRFNKKKFSKAVDFALTQTENHEDFYPAVRDAFLESGVVLVLLPNLKNSGVNGATKRIDGRIMLMVNDRRHYADTFWFTLFHEIGHIMNGDYGITFNKNEAEEERNADLYAQEKLIPRKAYENFVKETANFDEKTIRKFASQIHRDPGIVFGRLQKDQILPYTQTELGNRLRHHYQIIMD